MLLVLAFGELEKSVSSILRCLILYVAPDFADAFDI